MTLSVRDAARRIESSVLEPDTVRPRLDDACRAARRERFAAVCVRPCDLRRCAETLNGSRTAAATAVSFPHGGSTRTVKVHEAREAIEDAQSVLGSDDAAVELDLVVNAGSLLSGDWGALRDEILAVRDVVHARGSILKVVYEPGWLDDGQVQRLCETCGDLLPDFLAIGTGFGPRSATLDDVRLVRPLLPESIRLKATCEPQSREEFQQLLDAGADRIATARALDVLDALR